jgi:hypothetical protein
VICWFLVCFVMVICGEFVVECVANVVFYRTLFRGLKMGQVFEVYFSGDCFGKGALAKARRNTVISPLRR